MLKLKRHFSFHGRANRERYWLTTMSGYVVLIAGVIVAGAPGFGYWVTIGAYLAVLWLVLAVTVRRLHDRGRSGWWLLPMAGPTSLFSALGELASDEMVAAGLTVLGLPFAIWALVEIGFRKGTAGTNRFGPDPLEPVSQVFA